MNYYGRNIGDYARDTKHLSMVEHGAYSQLLDWYYASERPLPLDRSEIYRRVAATTDTDRSAVDTVLRDFFVEAKRGYRHKRCDEEIKLFKLKSNEARASARKRWSKSHANALPTQCEGNANQSQEPIPRTINQEPIKTKAIDQVREQFDTFWAAYPTKRRIGKAAAIKAWVRVPGVGNHVAEIILAVEKWKCTAQWQDPQFIPYPATFINQRRWEDEIPVEVAHGRPESKHEESQRRTLEAARKVIERRTGEIASPHGLALPLRTN